MFERLPPLKALRAFEAAARHGSFTEAAKELSLTQGAVSYQIKILESKLNIVLFARSARHVNLTPEGQTLFRTTHRLFRELEDEVHNIAPITNRLSLTISVSTYFVTRWLSQRLGNFLTDHPSITIRLQHSVNDPDFDLKEVDLAIRWGDGSWSRCESELLIPSPMIAVCSPKLIESETPIEQLSDLRHQVFLHDQEGNDGWHEWLLKAGLEDLGSGPGPVIVDPNVRVQSAIDGHGLVLANRLLSEDIVRGLLVEPFDIQLEGYGFYLVHTSKAENQKAFQLFRQWLLDEAGAFNMN
jgi:LysR family glycine cleavage system transcriptional activator